MILGSIPKKCILVLMAITILISMTITIGMTSFAPGQAGKGLILPKDFCLLTPAWFFTFGSTDTRFAESSSGQRTHLQIAKRVGLFGPKKLAVVTLRAYDIALRCHPGLGLGGQECICHNPRRIQTTPTSFLQTLLQSYLSTLALIIILSTW